MNDIYFELINIKFRAIDPRNEVVIAACWFR
jgi:hypothetical protein